MENTPISSLTAATSVSSDDTTVIVQDGVTKKASAQLLANLVTVSWGDVTGKPTFATVAIEVSVLEEVVGRLLNHTPITITGARYVRPSLDALRPSMEIVCSELANRIEGGGRCAD